MLSMNINHPDIIDFIKIKGGKDKTKVQYANISVKITNDFMVAVENDSDWEMIFELENGEKIIKTEKAKIIWNLFVDSNWEGAEPGILFWDNILTSPASALEDLKPISTNPCFSGDTLVLTSNGYEEIQKLVGKKVKVWNGEEWSLVEPRITAENQELYNIVFSNGKELKCTPYHSFYIIDNETKNIKKVEAKDLKQDDYLEEFNIPSGETIIKQNISIKEVYKIENHIEPFVYCFNEPLRHKATFNGILTGQCGEQALSAFSNCNLGSMNLSKFVKNEFMENAYFDFDLFSAMVRKAVRFLDNINLINIDRQPLKENKEKLEKSLPIGLGITGLADALIKLNLLYGSEKSLQAIDSIMKCLKENTIMASIDLAEERGMFPLLKQKKDDLIDGQKEYSNFISHPHFDFLDIDYKYKFANYGIRNSQYNTVAPNGSLSIILQGSSGLEPIFRTEYERTVINGKDNKQEKYITYHPLVLEYEKKTGKSYKENFYFITSDEIYWKDRVEVQATIQKYISESLSSTVNLPKDTTKETISELYMYAWKKGLKGITIYRDGCRDGVLNEVSNNKQVQKYDVVENYKFPAETKAIMKVLKSEGKKWYVTYTIDEETKLPNSLFVNTNSSETNIITNNVLEHLETLAKKYIKDEFIDSLTNKFNHQSNVVKIARFLSLLLRHRVPIIDIIETLTNAELPLTSFGFRIKKLLSEFIEGKYTGEKCSECGSQIVYQNGCTICLNCGNSKCG